LLVRYYEEKFKGEDMGGACSTREQKRKAYRILAGEPRRPRCKCKANIYELKKQY
jgi:hypothetical protein